MSRSRERMKRWKRIGFYHAEMIGSDAHRRLIVESSADDPIKTADDIESHRSQAAEIAQAAADVGKLANFSEMRIEAVEHCSHGCRLPLEASATSDDGRSVGPRASNHQGG